MLAIKIWKYLKGYVIISIEGLTLERLLNLCLTNGIYLSNVKRLNSTEIEVTVSNQGFKNLKVIAKKLGCRIKVKESLGLPSSLNRLKKRKMLGFGILLFIIVIVVLSSFIWEIEIRGNEQTPEDRILSLLEENNISIGKFKANIDIDHAKVSILKELDYLSFLDIRTKGVKLILNIKEEDIAPEIVDKSYPSHVVAKKKGVILKVIARNGRALVKAGQIVDEGTILISGVMDTLNNDTYLVHAEGEVIAQTRYKAISTMPIIRLDKKETGKVYKQKGIKIKERGIKLMKGQIPYKDYIEEVKETKFINLKWPDINIPIWIINYEYREVEIKEVKQTEEYVKKMSQLKAIEEINLQIPPNAEIIEKNVIHTIEDNIMRTQVIIETIEDIGKTKLLN